MEFYTNIQRVGNKFWLRYSDGGKDISTWVSDFQPTLYVKTNEKTNQTTIFDEPLKALQSESLKHAREMMKRYEGVQGFELYGNPLWEYSYLYERFGHRLKYDTKHIHCAYIDIETKVGENSIGFPYPYQALEEITLITHLHKGKYHIFSVGDFDIEEYNTLNLDTYKHVYDNEDDMLAGYLKHWKSDYPHAVTGWNIESFDCGYIINRIRQRLGDEAVKQLSPIGQIYLEFYEDDPTQLKKVQIRGVEILDYLLMYKKYRPGERDFSLDAMAEDFLKENKVENPTGGSFKAFYTGEFDVRGEPQNEIQEWGKRRTDLKLMIINSDDPELVKEFEALDKKIKRKCWNMFVWYNVRDVDIVKRLDANMGMLNLTYTIAYLVGMNYSDVFGTVKPWDIFLQNENALKRRFISVQDNRNSMPRELMGGFVHLYKAGLYKDGVTLDATSMYPMNILSMNISPDTIVSIEDVPHSLRPWADKNHIDKFLENGIPPELTQELIKHNMSMGLNGAFFRNDKRGFIPETVADVFSQRKAEKKLMLGYEGELEAVETELKTCTDPDRKKVLEQSVFNLEALVNTHHNTQLALKTLMNALYGAMGNEYFRHFNFYMAEAITSTGQFAIRYNTRAVDDYINKICGTKTLNSIYNDTDSISVSLQGVIDKMKVDRNNPKFVDVICKFADTKLNDQTAIACKEIGDALNFFDNRMSFKREKVFLSGLYVVKKRYALLVIDEEGVRFSEPKIKVTGLEIKRSDTPLKCRNALKEALEIILTKDQASLQKYVNEFEQTFRTLKPEEIATPSGVKGMRKYEDPKTIYIKGTPMHVRASLQFNKAVKDRKLQDIYPLIEEGAKMKYLKLQMPNTVNSTVIGFQDIVPPEFDVTQYIDWATMFEDNFAKAARRMVEAAGWSMEYVTDLDEWF